MSENEAGADDRTEEATPERRDEFRERGQLVVSKDLSAVMVLGGIVVFFSTMFPIMGKSLQQLMIASFEAMATYRVNAANVIEFAQDIWLQTLILIIPVFVVVLAVAVASTFLQTRLNWSWEKLTPDFSRLDPWTGFIKMFTLQTVVEVGKNVAKMIAVGAVTYVILYSEWGHVPELMSYPVLSTWSYWSKITKSLFWSVAGLLLVLAGFDYLYSFFTFEKKMKMTKQEVKEEYKRRESDPHVKAKMRRMQRDAANRKTIEKTRKATVIVTNPTHYAVALHYEVGGSAPVLLAKGIDHLALQMREVAKEEKIPIIENRPLARALYASVEEGDEIPEKFYRTVAEIIRYVFRLKGRAIPVKQKPKTAAPPPA